MAPSSSDRCGSKRALDVDRRDPADALTVGAHACGSLNENRCADPDVRPASREKRIRSIA
jgi:hypothetical protein